ncbi:hypothetical protein D3C77_808140 [compost metagenome]
MGGIDQPLVKHQVAGHISIDITVKMPGTVGQGITQRLQVGVGSAQCGQADGLGFEDVPGFTGLLGRAA